MSHQKALSDRNWKKLPGLGDWGTPQYSAFCKVTFIIFDHVTCPEYSNCTSINKKITITIQSGPFYIER